MTVGFLDPGEWSTSFGQSLIDLYLFDVCGPQRIVREGGRQLRNFCAAGGLVAGRNEVAKQFLDATDAEWLFMVDSDMGFGADTVERLVSYAHYATHPVVGGLCFGLKRDSASYDPQTKAELFTVAPTVYEWVESPDEVGFRIIPGYPRDALMKVAATGAACLLVHRGALVKVRGKYGDCWFDPVTHPVGPRTFSEDLSFCVKLAGVGVPIHVATGVKTSHHKGGVYLDEEAFDRQETLRALEREPVPA